MKRFLIATGIGLLGFVCVCWTLANPGYLMAYIILLLLNTVAIHGWDLLLNR